MSAAGRVQTTYAEYLALEADSGVRHEFVEGFAYAMAGGDPEHARLAMQLGGDLVVDEVYLGVPGLGA